MPQLGEVKKGTEVGQPQRYQKFMWCACLDCGVERWVLIRKGIPKSKRCVHCSFSGKRDKSFGWKGGRHTTTGGYIKLMLPIDDFFSSMGDTANHYVFEHRLVMAKSLGRSLQPWEIVHHKNGIKDDNRKENLELSTKYSHLTDHNKGYRDGFNKGYYDGKGKRVRELELQLSKFVDA